MVNSGWQTQNHYLEKIGKKYPFVKESYWKRWGKDIYSKNISIHKDGKRCWYDYVSSPQQPREST